MSDSQKFRQIAEHLYENSAHLMQGGIGDAFQLQKRDLNGHIAATIESDGPQEAVAHLYILAEYSQSYNGRSNPYLGDVYNSI